MTAPLAFPQQQVPTAMRPWQSMPGGYDQAIQQQGGQPQQMQPLQQDISPLSQVPPRQAVMPWEQTRQQPQIQPQQQQPLPQPQGQFQAPPGVDLNARIHGGNIPQELQGRTVGELVGMLNGLRQVHLQSLQQGGPQQQPQVQQQPIQQPAAQQQGQPGAFDWRKPEESFGKLIDDRLNLFQQRLGPMFAPVIQQGHIQQASAAMNQVAAEIPNFAQLQPAIFARLQNIDPAALANPETWRVAARVVIGDMALQQRGQQPIPMGGQHIFPQNQGGPQPFQPQQVQMGQNPAPGYASWFSEQPQQGGQFQAPLQLRPEQMRAADAMGMSHADYSAWTTGVQPMAPQQAFGRR